MGSEQGSDEDRKMDKHWFAMTKEGAPGGSTYEVSLKLGWWQLCR